VQTPLTEYQENAFETSNLLDEEDARQIQNDAEAERILRRIREVEADAMRQAKACEVQIKWYQRRSAQIQTRAEQGTSTLRAKLEEYFRTVPRRFTKSGKQIYNLPSGKLIERPTPPDYIRDDALLLSWARRTNPSYIRTKEEPAWTEIKKDGVLINGSLAHKDTGEIIPGISVTLLPPRFMVEYVKEDNGIWPFPS
jgi:phage host-nuclease inhibitor protein Gam